MHYRIDPAKRGKFDASTAPGLFAGWRFDAGPKSHKNVYYVVDYKRVKEKQSGYHLPIAVPAEELFIEEGAPKLPLKIAADEALANFKEVNLEQITALDIPFSSIDGETSVRKRNEYITLDTIIRFGATPGCRACEFASEHAQHSAKCRARFNGLIRADRIASSGISTPPPTPVVPPTPATHRLLQQML